MMIVIGLLGLLLAIVLPTFGKASAISRRTVCQANLSHIGQAYNMRRSAEPTGERTSFKADNWASDLLPYLSYHPRALYCPDDAVPVDGMPDVKFWVHRGYYMEMTTAYPYWLEYAAGDVPGGVPGVWRLNDEVYQTIRPLMAERRNCVDLLPIYTPGQDPYLFWYVFEDQRIGDESWAGDDQDFEDLIVRVVRSRTGTITITLWKGATYHSFDLIGPGDEVIATNITGGGLWTFPGAPDISYGMNWRAEHIAKGQHKILALDYEREVCNVGAGAPLLGNGWGVDKAPRHLGKTNVLFAEGQVVTMDVDEIDPGIDSLDGQYWDPARPVR